MIASGALLCGTSITGPSVAPRAESVAARAHARTRASRVVPVVRTDPRSGAAVHTIVVAPQAPPRPAHPDPSVQAFMAQMAEAYDLSPALVDSVIRVESGYNPYAVSSKGAEGIMQLMPATARRFGVHNAFDPRDNIAGGVRYLKFLQDTFKDDTLAIAAYNAGEGAVAKYNNTVPPYPETRGYVEKVTRRYTRARRKAEAKTAQAKAETPQPAAPEHRPLHQYVDAQGRVYLSTE